MAFYPVLILSLMYFSTGNAQFCNDVISRGEACFSAPSDCSTDDCEMTMAAVDNNDTFTITLTGKSDGWIAIGFSADQVMGRDDVIMCIYDGSEVTLQHRYNVNNQKNNVEGTDLGDDLVLLQQSTTEGVISCTFNRTKSVDGVMDAFGLEGSNWYALFGKGPATNGQPRIHNEFPWTSTSRVDLASGDVIEVSSRDGNPTPTPRPSTTPDDKEEKITPTSKGVKSPASVPGIVILLLTYILFLY